ncbi:MAG: hypothetical protein WKF43_09885 [Acidimicrobiales bacterium]
MADPDSGPSEQREVWLRLVLAGSLTLPLLLLSMFGSLQVDGWQWWAAALATPVVLVSGWDFHRGALGEPTSRPS